MYLDYEAAEVSLAADIPELAAARSGDTVAAAGIDQAVALAEVRWHRAAAVGLAFEVVVGSHTALVRPAELGPVELHTDDRLLPNACLSLAQQHSLVAV